MKNAKNPLGSWEKTIKSIEVDTVSDEMLQSMRSMLTIDTFQNLIPTLQAKLSDIETHKAIQRRREENTWNDLQKKVKEEIDRLGGTSTFTITDKINSTNMTSVKSPFIIDDYKVPNSLPLFFYDNPPMSDKQRSAIMSFLPTINSAEEIQVELELYQLESFLQSAKLNIQMPENLPLDI